MAEQDGEEERLFLFKSKENNRFNREGNLSGAHWVSIIELNGKLKL